MKAIKISPVRQRGRVGGDPFHKFTILVKETNPYFDWYKKKASFKVFKIREELEVHPSRRTRGPDARSPNVEASSGASSRPVTFQRVIQQNDNGSETALLGPPGGTPSE